MAKIPRATLDASYRRLVRDCAGQILHAMAYCDMGPDEIGARLNVKSKTVRKWLHEIIEGRTSNDGHEISDIARALDCRLSVHFEPIPDEAA